MRKEKVIVLAIFFPFSLFATSFVQRSVEDHIRQADAVCPVEVQSIDSRKVNNNFQTLISVKKLSACLKGNTSVQFQIVLPGGRDQSHAQVIPGSPRFRRNQKILAFLKQENSEFFLSSWENPDLEENLNAASTEDRWSLKGVRETPRVSGSASREVQHTPTRKRRMTLSEFRRNYSSALKDPTSNE